MNDFSTSALLKKRLSGRNLYLVGMMGCGKSSTGPYLAQELSYSFVDSDLVIEKVVGKSISTIFETDGEEIFRTIETNVLKEIGQRHSLVVATGGGIVTKPENWGFLHQGIVIWIDPGRDCLWARLQSDSQQRPLIKKIASLDAFDALLEERHRFYVESDLHLQVGEEKPQQVAKKILEDLPSILTPLEGPV